MDLANQIQRREKQKANTSCLDKKMFYILYFNQLNKKNEKQLRPRPKKQKKKRNQTKT